MKYIMETFLRHLRPVFPTLALLMFQGVALASSINPELYISENPKRALTEFRKTLVQAKLADNKEQQAWAMLSIAQIYLNQNFTDKAQQAIDSAYYFSKSAVSDSLTVRVQLFQAMYWVHTGNTEQAHKSTEKVLSLAGASSNKGIRIETLLSIGDLYQQAGKTSSALATKRDALGRAQQLNYPRTDNIYHSLGRTYWQASRFDEALENYRLALEFREKRADTSGIVSTLRNIGLVLRDQGELNKAREVLHKALSLSEKQANSSQTADLLNLMGTLLAKQGSHLEAIGLFNESLSIRQQIGFLQSSAATLDNMARSQKELALYPNAIESLNRSLQLRREIEDSKGEAASLNEIGNLFVQQNNLSDALRYYLQSLRIRQRLGQPIDISRSLTNIGLVYRKLNSHENALKYFKNALELTHGENDPMGVSFLHIHIGNTLKDMGKSREALQNFHKALELRKKTNNKIQVASAIRSIAITHSELSEFNLASEYLNQALAIYKEIKDLRGEADVYNELGNIAMNQKKNKDALRLFAKALELYTQINDLDKKGLCLRKIGEIYSIDGNWEISGKYLSDALAIAKLTKNAKLLELTLFALYSNLNKTGNYREALDKYLRYSQIKDSLSRITEQESILQMSVELELGKKMDEIKQIESEIALLKTEAELKTAQIERQKLVRNSLTAIIALLLLLVMAIAYGYMAYRKANRKLVQSEKELKQTVETKDKLFSIVAHDLRSPFNALAGLTEVLAQQAETFSTQEVKEYSQSVHEASLNLLALTDNLLHWSRAQTGRIDINPKPNNIQELVVSCVSALQLQANQKGISIEHSIAADLNADIDRDTVNTVIRNLISNAIKFTNPGGTVTLSAYENNGKTTISIADTGVGMDESQLHNLFKLKATVSTRGTNNEAGTGIGLIVCKEFVELNGGSLTVDSIKGKGTTFYINLPKRSITA